MKKITAYAILTILLSICPLFAGGQKENSENSKEYKDSSSPDWLIENTEDHLTIIDNGEHEVVIKKPVNKIIVRGMGVYPTLRALKAEKMVLAAPSIEGMGGELLFPVMTKLPSIGKGGPGDSLDYEQIIALEPDVFITLTYERDTINEKLAPEIPVIQLDFASVKDIRILGTILNKEKEANEYISWIEGISKTITDKVENLSKDDLPKVFSYYGGEYGMAPPPPYGSYGKDNDLSMAVRTAGGNSITSDIPGEWICVDPEWIIEQNPQIVIRELYINQIKNPILGYTTNNSDKAKAKLDEVISLPVFETGDSILNNNIYLIDGRFISNVWFLGINYLAKWFHPDLFNDLDPQAIHQEFLSRFMRIDFDLSKQGVFVYPEVY